MSGPYQPMASGIASLTARRCTVCRSTRSTRDGCSAPSQSVALPADVGQNRTICARSPVGQSLKSAAPSRQTIPRTVSRLGYGP